MALAKRCHVSHIARLGWAISSVGRASRLHREGQRFEPVIAHHPLPLI